MQSCDKNTPYPIGGFLDSNNKMFGFIKKE